MNQGGPSDLSEKCPWPLEASQAVTGMMVLDAADFRVVSVNAPMLELLRASSEQVLGKTWSEMAALQLRLGAAPLFSVVTPVHLLEGELKTASLPLPDGIFIELHSYPIPDRAGGVREIVLVAIDVSTRIRFEGDLNQRIYERDVANEFSKALQRTVDLNEVLYVTLAGVTARQGLQFNRAFLFLFSRHFETLEAEVAVGPSDSMEASIIWGELSQKAWTLGDLLSAYDSNHPLGDAGSTDRIRHIKLPVPQSKSILVRSLLERKSFNVVDGVNEGDGAVDQALRDALGCDTFAVIPLYTRLNPIGVLIVDNWINKSPISLTEIKLLEVFAGHASSSIEISQLYQDLRGKVRALETSRAALKESQQRLLRAERLSSVGKMAATVAHEIRNPLVSIGGFARLLKQQIPEDNPMHEDVEIILSEVRRLEKIVTNILQYSHTQQALLQPTHVDSVINRTLDMLRLELQERKIEAKTAFHPDAPPVKADEAQLLQVFYNLIINAIQALEGGGTIAVSTEEAEGAVLVRVKDNGCGIAKENLGKIFTAFFTTKPSGAGLGLSVVSEIVDAHGGNVSVVSEPGSGTEVLIRLPVSGGAYGRETDPGPDRRR